MTTFSRSIALAAITALGLGSVSPSQSQFRLPTGFTVDDLITTGLAGPMDIDFLPDGRMLIAERAGGVRLWTGTGPTVAVGTQGGVSPSGERGLLSVAVDPDFPTNGYIYLWHSRSGSRLSVTRRTLVGDRTDPNSTNLAFGDERRLLNCPDNQSNHNGGVVRFGPDGMLYLTTGDDGSACAAQNPTGLLGKVLRLDVSAVGPGPGLTPPAPSVLAPNDNPTAGDPVFAMGLRNPFRMAIDPVTGALYIGDVGEGAHEEISECPGGGGRPLTNFGWPWREANGVSFGCSGTAPANLVGPIAVEDHANGWSSIVAGPRYRNLGGTAAFGPAYEGDLFYFDYFSGNVRRYQRSGATWGLAPAAPGQPSNGFWATGLGSVAVLRQGPEGGLYAVQQSSPGSVTGGFIRRIRPVGPVPTVAVVGGAGQFTPAGTVFPQAVEFEVRDAGGNLHPGGVVNLTVSGPGTVPTATVTADSRGRVSTSVHATNVGGSLSTIAVVAATPGGDPAGVSALVFRRNLSVTVVQSIQTIVVLQIANASPDTNPVVPFLITLGSVTDPGVPTVFGNVCPNPLLPTSLVIEDGFGLFGGVSLAPGGPPVGTPSLTQIYNFPPGVLPGLQWKMQAIGFDSTAGGYFITDTERVTL